MQAEWAAALTQASAPCAPRPTCASSTSQSPSSCPSPQLSHSLQLHNPLALVASVRRGEGRGDLRASQSTLEMAGSWGPARWRMGSQEIWVPILLGL